MITAAEIEDVYHEILLRFGCCACRCGREMSLDRAARYTLRDIFDKTVVPALKDPALGLDDWNHKGGREYILGRVCKIAETAAVLASISQKNRIDEASLRKAVDEVVHHAQSVIERLQNVKAGQKVDPYQPEEDWGVAFGRYCRDY